MTKFEGDCKIIKCPCPGLVEFVERGELESDALYARLQEIFLPCSGVEIDAIVLGCTHYPFLKAAIEKVVGEKPLLLDGSDGTAKETRRRLLEAGLLNEEGKGSVRPENSLKCPEIFKLGETLLQLP